MAYKTCENCGCRVYAQGCVNCDEMEYISMQEDYMPPKKVAKNLQQGAVMPSLPQDNFCKVCNLSTDGEKCYSKRCPI